MSKPIEVKAGEKGLVRVFALSMEDRAAKDLKEDAQALEQVLGASVDVAGVEVFAVSDLGDMPLADYLVEGPGIAEDVLEQDRIKLGALDGWVMLVYSSAFAGKAATLSPAPSLTLIGEYPQEGVDWSGGVDLSTPSALPYQDDATPARKKPSDAAMAGRVATVALLVLFALVGLMIWVAA